MRILVINVGSSSVKLSVTDMPAGERIFKAELAVGTANIGDVLRSIPALLEGGKIAGIEAVGHRVAHGADRFREATRLDDAVIAGIEALSAMAPQHNPPALEGIRVARASWPQLPQVAVFDTAFHADMPPAATAYAIPQAWRRAGIRRFGFHGTSHKYVMERVAAALEVSPRELRIVSCHLGNGASVCAIERGRSIDTSMGMTPLEGLVMGSRSGDVDPGLVVHVHRTLGLSVEAIEDALYRQSGLAGLSGRGNDLRDIEAAAAQGDARSQLALAVYAYRARKYIGAYAAAMGGMDVVAFTGGIGENSASMRRCICERLEFLGLRLDEDANSSLRLREFEAAQIQDPDSAVRVIVTQAREQWMIAQEVHRLLGMRHPHALLLPEDHREEHRSQHDEKQRG
jgi:acetate kinase